MEVDVGVYSGKSFDGSIREKYKKIEYDFRPEGECSDDVKKRVKGFLSDLKDKYSDKKVLIVTHGGIIRMINHLVKNKDLGDLENV